MFRVLLSRRWLTALLVAALFFLACLFLGRWQYGRHVEKQTRADLVRAHYDASPVPLSDVVPPGSTSLPDEEVWRRVEVTGRYEPAGRLMVRNRPKKVTYGYEVLDTLRLPDGGGLLVDRGWVKNAERADVLPDVPAAPTGEVRVVGWLRQGEDPFDSRPPAGQLASIDLAAAQRQLPGGLPLRPAYLVLDSERTASGATPPRPEPLLPPDTDTGPHFAYSLQWWGASIVGFVLVFVYARREYEDSLGEGGAPRREPRARKTRIWDEEDG